MESTHCLSVFKVFIMVHSYYRLMVSSGVYGVTLLRIEREGKAQWSLACPLGGRAPLNGVEGSSQNVHSGGFPFPDALFAAAAPTMPTTEDLGIGT